MERINIAHFTTDFRSRRDIETALAWNAVKKTLLELDRGDLFEMIQSVKITDKYITLTTRKPIVNEELKLISGILLARVNTGLKTLGSHEKTKIKLV